MKKNDFDQLKNSWNTYGKTEPFWGVITHNNFKQHNLNESELSKFYQSGKNTIDKLEKILNQHQSTFENKLVLDFGCGVGRLTKPCLEICKKIYGLDISQSYLDIAKKTVPNGEFFLVDDFNKLPNLPSNPDIIYSMITLQHNRPVLMKLYLFLLLKSLNKDGIALLHIPYKINNYIPYQDNHHRMEMHFLEKSDVRKLVNTVNCQISDIVETNGCGENIFDCIYVIKKI
jgi:SAM-dependent methyltransferase